MPNQFLARMAGQPSLLAPLRERIESCLDGAARSMLAITERDAQSPPAVMQDDFWFAADDWRAAYRPYVVKDGLLHIPVKGVLLHDFPYALGSWATGYEYIWKAFQRGVADGNVRGIALVIDSPGGEVAGNFDLVDRIHAKRGVKPIRAFVSESGYSAAYSIASAADDITVSRTGGVGSIGVVTMHVDASKMLDDIGWKITFIFAGKHKVDGNFTEKLPDDVKARIQAHIDELYGMFVAIVARNRGLEESAVRATEALTYSATEARSIKLADNIGALDDALAAYAADMSPEDDGDDYMSTDRSAPERATIDAARAEGRTEGEAAGRDAGRTQGASEMQARCKEIIASDESKGRSTMAAHLAFETEMSSEAAIKLLATAPKEPEAKAEGNRFDQAMKNAGNPAVGPDAANGNKDPDDIEGIMASAGYGRRKTA